GASLVAPRVAPERAGHRQDDRRQCHVGLASCGGRERGSIVAGAQPPEAVVIGCVVVDARWEIREFRADEVKLQVVARTCSTGRPELSCSPPPLELAAEEAIGEEPDSRHRGTIRKALLTPAAVCASACDAGIGDGATSRGIATCGTVS